MSKTNRPKKNDIEKLRKILDNNSKNKSSSEKEKYLATLTKRLKKESRNIHISSKVVEKENESLEPKITVHPRKVEKIVEFHEIAEDITSKDVEPEESSVIDEDVFEVKKVEIDQPQFIEVKQRDVKEDETEEFEKKKTIAENEFTEWEPVEGEKEEELPDFSELESEEKESFEYEDQVEIEKVEVKIKEEASTEKEPEEDAHFCPNCGHKLRGLIDFCPNCGDKLSSDEEAAPSFIPVKEPEPEKEAIVWEEQEDVEEEKPEEVEQVPELETKPSEIKEEESLVNQAIPVDDDLTEEEEFVDNASKIEVFKDIENIDEETAVLLYDNGFTSLDALTIASVKDLSKIKGIKKSKAKKIKKEINQESEWEPVEDEETIEEEIDETEELELQAEIEAKKEIFKDLESIDEKTAIILYDNGYTTIDLLKEADLKELIKIKGMKRKIAKKIMMEIDQIIEEKTKVKPIDIGVTSKGEITEEQIKEEDEVIEEKKGPNPVELSAKSDEWEPIEEIKEEKTKKPLKWEPVEDEETIEEEIDETEELELQAEIEAKKEIFKDLESIDEKTAIILYDNGYTTIDLLKEANIKELKKIKGLKKKHAKSIIKEIEEKFKEPEEIISPDKKDENEYFEEDEKIMEESDEIDDKIANYAESSKPNEDFFEEEIKEDIPSIELEKDETFNGIKSIDDKISKLLKQNDISSIKDLENTTVKDLTKVRGIKRKIAKQIKKEVNELVTSRSQEESYDEDKNPYTEEEKNEDEWESFDEDKDKISEKQLNDINGFRHGDYTLYEKETKTQSGAKRKIRFFSKGEIEGAEPIQLPKGYEIKENKKTGVPYLKKKRKK